ncbi:MAG: hypothetical protein ACYS8Z_04280 [Planctomycetota bacterium]
MQTLPESQKQSAQSPLGRGNRISCKRDIGHIHGINDVVVDTLRAFSAHVDLGESVEEILNLGKNG